MSNQLEKKQQKRCRCGSIKHLRVSSKDCPVRLAIRKAKILALVMALYQYEAKKTAGDATSEEESKCLVAEDAGEGEKSAAEVTANGSLWLGLVLLGGSLHRRRWLDCIVLIVLGWLYWMNHIGWIVSVSVLGFIGKSGFYALAGFLLAILYEWTGWDVGGTGVRWREIC